MRRFYVRTVDKNGRHHLWGDYATRKEAEQALAELAPASRFALRRLAEITLFPGWKSGLVLAGPVEA